MVPKVGRWAQLAVVQAPKDVIPSHIVHVSASDNLVFGDFVQKEFKVFANLGLVGHARPGALHVHHITIRNNPDLAIEVSGDAINDVPYLSFDGTGDTWEDLQLHNQARISSIVNILEGIRGDRIVLSSSNDDGFMA